MGAHVTSHRENSPLNLYRKLNLHRKLNLYRKLNLHSPVNFSALANIYHPKILTRTGGEKIMKITLWESHCLWNNYWMRLSMISRIIQTEVNVICRSRRLRTLTKVWIILDIMRKPNPIIVLLYIQNSHTKMQAKCGSKKTHVEPGTPFEKWCARNWNSPILNYHNHKI